MLSARCRLLTRTPATDRMRDLGLLRFPLDDCSIVCGCKGWECHHAVAWTSRWSKEEEWRGKSCCSLTFTVWSPKSFGLWTSNTLLGVFALWCGVCQRLRTTVMDFLGTATFSIGFVWDSAHLNRVASHIYLLSIKCSPLILKTYI